MVGARALTDFGEAHLAHLEHLGESSLLPVGAVLARGLAVRMSTRRVCQIVLDARLVAGFALRKRLYDDSGCGGATETASIPDRLATSRYAPAV